MWYFFICSMIILFIFGIYVFWDEDSGHERYTEMLKNVKSNYEYIELDAQKVIASSNVIKYNFEDMYKGEILYFTIFEEGKEWDDCKCISVYMPWREYQKVRRWYHYQCKVKRKIRSIENESQEGYDYLIKSLQCYAEKEKEKATEALKEVKENYLELSNATDVRLEKTG